jgi:hypothetical protein
MTAYAPQGVVNGLGLCMERSGARWGLGWNWEA